MLWSGTVETIPFDEPIWSPGDKGIKQLGTLDFTEDNKLGPYLALDDARRMAIRFDDKVRGGASMVGLPGLYIEAKLTGPV